MTSRHENREDRLFDRIAPSYVKKDLTPYCRIARKLRLFRTLKNVPKPVGALLEIGCGAGFSADYLRGQYGRMVGIDRSANLIAFARQYNGSPQASFYRQDVKDFSTDQRFNVILMIGVLHHLNDADLVLTRLSSCLAEGGVLLANEPQKGNPLIVLMRRIRKRVDPEYAMDQIEFSERELEEVFTRCGYTIQLFPQGFLSTPLAETRILPRLIGIPLAWLVRVVDPILEAVLSGRLLRKLAWNIVVEARVARKQ